ncbi:MAG TPA: hypothetical protein VJ206_03805 [bacterium]|nr:hypothetical protein [bacterium]
MTPGRPDLPSGTVTFLFTDVEGSTKLLRDLGAEAYAATLALHRRHGTLHRELGDAWGTAYSQFLLGGAYALLEGRVQDAIPRLTEAIRIHRTLGDVLETGVDLCRLAYALAVAGSAETAARALSCAEGLYERSGARMPSWMAGINERTRTAIRTQLDEGAVAAAWERGRALTPDDAVALALDSLD